MKKLSDLIDRDHQKKCQCNADTAEDQEYGIDILCSNGTDRLCGRVQIMVVSRLENIDLTGDTVKDHDEDRIEQSVKSTIRGLHDDKSYKDHGVDRKRHDQCVEGHVL